MKKVELLFSALLVPLDYLMLLLAGWLAYRIRFGATVIGIREVIYALPFGEFLKALLLSSLMMLIIFAWIGLYEIIGTRRVIDEFRKVFLACSTGVLIVIILFFFNRELFSSRFIILTTWVLSIVLVALMRWIVIMVERLLLSKGIGIHQILLIGNTRTAQILDQAITQHPTLGFRIIERAHQVNGDLLTKLAKITKVKHIDEVLVADPDLTHTQAARLIEFCKTHHLQFKYTADLFDAQMKNMVIQPLAGIPIVEVHNTPLQGWGRIYKRMLDMILGALLIVVFSPMMIATAMAILLESPGPIIYRNRRVGENGKVFDTLKFRSMYQQYCIGDQFDTSAQALAFEQRLIQEKSIKDGPIYKIKDDPRVTKVGKFLRRTSIDELLQFFNVLLGNMSIVGPRPHQPREVAKYEEHHRIVLNMKPGVTGLAQISGRSDLEFEEEVRLDTYYMENWSIFLDLYIMIKTPLVIFKRRQAL